MAALATPTKPCETKDEARAHLVTLKGSQIAWPKGRKDVKLVIASMPAFEAVSRNTHGHPRWSIKVENYGQPCVEGLDERNIVMRSDKGAEMKVFGVNHVTWTDSKMYIWPVDGEQNPYDDAMRTEFESKFPVGTSVTFHTVTRTEHALQNSWSIWEHRKVTAARQEQAEAWDASVFRVCDFATVEGFWRYFHAIPPPGKIFFNGQFKPELRGRNVEAFSVFKAGVKPSWESSANKGLLYVKQSFNVRQINSCWESIVLACIGEVLDEKHSGIVCGCKVRGAAPVYLSVYLSTPLPLCLLFVYLSRY